MTNNSNVHFNLGRWLGPRWWWEGRWRCGVNPITPPPPSPVLAPSFYLPSTHPRPLNAFASCFQVRTERCDWPLLAQWAVPHALCSARVTVELGLPHTPECTVLQTVRKKNNIPAWKCWWADLGATSRSRGAGLILPRHFFVCVSWSNKLAGRPDCIFTHRPRSMPELD